VSIFSAVAVLVAVVMVIRNRHMFLQSSSSYYHLKESRVLPVEDDAVEQAELDAQVAQAARDTNVTTSVTTSAAAEEEDLVLSDFD
jgi:hypothetical protein